MIDSKFSRELMVNSMKRTIDHGLDPLLLEKSVALLDYPNHPNVGDSAIWLGEMTYLTSRNIDVRYISEIRDYSEQALQSALPDGPILLHGGGNFGDVWPRHQRFREDILARFPDREIIQLPQSIHYSDPSEIGKTAAVIARHGNFTLMVRDLPSYELARQHFDCAVIMAPDMAFYLGALSRPSAATSDTLFLMRTDHEALTQDGSEARAGEDWLKEDSGALSRSRRLAVLRDAVLTGSIANRRHSSFQAMASHRLRRGVRQLSRGRYVVTDRLHAHILSTLLDIPHAILDNNYGKLTRFHSAWTSRYANVHAARSLNDARAWALSQA